MVWHNTSYCAHRCSWSIKNLTLVWLREEGYKQNPSLVQPIHHCQHSDTGLLCRLITRMWADIWHLRGCDRIHVHVEVHKRLSLWLMRSQFPAHSPKPEWTWHFQPESLPRDTHTNVPAGEMWCLWSTVTCWVRAKHEITSASQVPSIRWIRLIRWERQQSCISFYIKDWVLFFNKPWQVLRKSIVIMGTSFSLTLQPTARRTLRTTIADRTATIILGWSSRTAGQKVNTKTEPDRQRATTIENQRSHSNGRIHRTLWRKPKCVISVRIQYKYQGGNNLDIKCWNASFLQDKIINSLVVERGIINSAV